jgi:NAD(P)-dependent dehydrogenase (short-subunit alcohol dehydrogenase family)
MEPLSRWFGLDDHVAVVTGRRSHGARARAAGARRRNGHDRERAEAVVGDPGRLAVPADVLRREDLVAAGGRVLDEWGWVDILVNAACGNMAGATLGKCASVFDNAQRRIARRST